MNNAIACALDMRMIFFEIKYKAYITIDILPILVKNHVKHTCKSVSRDTEPLPSSSEQMYRVVFLDPCQQQYLYYT